MDVGTLRTTARSQSGINGAKLKKWAGKIAFYLLLLIIFVYTIFPFYWAIVSSLKTDSDLSATPVQYWPDHPTLDNYIKVLSNGDFLTALRNSTIVAGSVTLLSLVIGSMAAYSLGRFRFRGRSVVMYSVLAMTIFPQIAVLGALYQIVNLLHIYNTLWSLMLTYLIFTLPFTTWVLTNFFKAIPGEIEEAAFVDGATPIGIFWRIMLPLALPGLVTTGLLAFINAWNEFLFALSFTQTPENHTITIAIQSFAPQTSGSFQIPWGQEMAASVLVTIPLIALALIFQRGILAGLTAGGVKG